MSEFAQSLFSLRSQIQRTRTRKRKAEIWDRKKTWTSSEVSMLGSTVGSQWGQDNSKENLDNIRR